VDWPVDLDFDQVGKFSLTLRGACSRAASDGEPSSAVDHAPASALHGIWSALWALRRRWRHSTAVVHFTWGRRAGVSRSIRTTTPHTTFRGYRGGFPARHAACASAFGERRISTGPTQQPNRARAEPRSFAREFGDARQRGGRRPTLNDNSSRESPLRSKRNAYRSSSRNIFGADGVRRASPSQP
jgi:hypothetical protein